MLKGFFSLICIFGIGLWLMSIALPEQFGHVRNYAHMQYEHLSDVFTKHEFSTVSPESRVLTDSEEVIDR